MLFTFVPLRDLFGRWGKERYHEISPLIKRSAVFYDSFGNAGFDMECFIASLHLRLTFQDLRETLSEGFSLA